LLNNIATPGLDIKDLFFKVGREVVDATQGKQRPEISISIYDQYVLVPARPVQPYIAAPPTMEQQITIAEGVTSEQIVQHLLESDVLSGNIKEIPREGTMLPGTYGFARDTPRDEVIQRMQQAQRRVVQEIWDRRMPDLPLRSPEQLVILASIVEKETSRSDERTRVAAVFINRLKQRMKLQADPTIIYGLVGGKGTLGRPIQRSEIDQPTPYNTYVIDGLPPGPIANPAGRARGGRQPGAHQGTLFRRRRQRRTRVFRNARPAPKECRASARNRAGPAARDISACVCGSEIAHAGTGVTSRAGGRIRLL
jgi:hypothetical protein